MHHQHANAYNGTNTATSTHRDARAITDSHNRAVQHAGPNGDSDSCTNCNRHGNAYTHAIANRDTDTYTDTDGNADADTHGHTDSDTHSDANADPGTHRDSHTVAKHRRATRGSRRILRRD